MLIARPSAADFGPNFGKYVALVPEGDIRQILESQLRDALPLLRGVSETESLVKHAPYTWSLREVLGHVTDAERIFAYRALRFARGDATPLPSFDENAYARTAQFDRVPFAELLAEFEHVRRANLQMLHHLDGEAWTRRGTASGVEMTVTAMGYVIAGHCKHHLDIIKTRLKKA